MGDPILGHATPLSIKTAGMCARISVVYAQMMLCVFVFGIVVVASGTEVQDALSETAADDAAFYRIYRAALLAEPVSPESVLLEMDTETNDLRDAPRTDSMDGVFNRFIQDAPVHNKDKWKKWNYLTLDPKQKTHVAHKSRQKAHCQDNSSIMPCGKFHDNDGRVDGHGFPSTQTWKKSTMKQDSGTTGAPMGHPLLGAAGVTDKETSKKRDVALIQELNEPAWESGTAWHW